MTAEYNPEEDVGRLAEYFQKKYGSLDAARKAFDAEASWRMDAFERALKKWGVKVNSSAELFGHIDADCSGTISIEELWYVLEAPIEERARREIHRQRVEVNLIYKEMARCIREKFGSIEEAFVAKQWLQRAEPGRQGSLSLAQFRALVNTLDMELQATVLQRVFNEIDADRTGEISIEELQKALSFQFVRQIVIELATMLTERFGSVAKAFEGINAITPGSLPTKVTLPNEAIPGRVAPPPPPTQTLPTVGESRTAETGCTEEKLLQILRQLKVLDNVTEHSARMLHACLRPSSVEDFARRIHSEYSQEEEAKKQRMDDEERREKEHKRKLAQSLRVDSHHRAVKEVKSWLENASKDPKRTITAAWSAAARAGASKTQLRDYVLVLEGEIRERSAEVERIKMLVDKEVREAEFLREFVGVTPSHVAATPVGDAGVLKFGNLGDMTPMTPSAASFFGRASPTAPSLEATLQKEDKTIRVERVMQAASIGDLAAMKRFLDDRADINAVAWGGVTPLMSAAHHGRLPMVLMLLESHADPVRTDMHGRTALDHAKKQPARVQEELRGNGLLGRQELERMAQSLARQLLHIDQQRTKLEGVRDQLPSEEVKQRARLRLRLAQAGSQDSTPAVRAQAQLRRASSSPYPSPLSEASPSPTGLGVFGINPQPMSCLNSNRPPASTAPPAKPAKQVTLTLPVSR
eukprot:TRINITY_DN15180_c0_g1_i4.p1 TRINITY_DN15180_c0_g1~~TRINITY_DN15180_c0_g1_i4.p1  ORF type:complete len:696 (+),score=174.33 TRINITY_DN15180_c0_g1_i4:1340-3427(+)